MRWEIKHVLITYFLGDVSAKIIKIDSHAEVIGLAIQSSDSFCETFCELDSECFCSDCVYYFLVCLNRCGSFIAGCFMCLGVCVCVYVLLSLLMNKDSCVAYIG